MNIFAAASSWPTGARPWNVAGAKTAWVGLAPTHAHPRSPAQPSAIGQTDRNGKTPFLKIERPPREAEANHWANFVRSCRVYAMSFSAT